MLPLARPAIAVLTVFTFIGFWGSFLWPLIIVNSVETKGTVPLGLAQFSGQQGTQWNLMMAASVMAMLPTVPARHPAAEAPRPRPRSSRGLGGR